MLISGTGQQPAFVVLRSRSIGARLFILMWPYLWSRPLGLSRKPLKIWRNLIRDTDNAQYRREDELFYEMSAEGEVVLYVFFETRTQNLSSATGYAL